MFIKKSTVISLSILSLTLISNQALAVEKTGSTTFLSAWPLILLVVLTIVFRKKIFTETSVELPEETSQEEIAPANESTPAPKKSPPTTKETTKSKASASTKQEKPKTNTSTNGLSDDGQCQGSTAKGARCKRTTTLEKISVKIDNKTYQLIACSQHNKDKFKPYPGLIK